MLKPEITCGFAPSATQACEATGNEPFRYLLYKDVNRHMPLFFHHER